MSDNARKTKSAVAYDLLKKRLRTGEFEPGERLTEAKLARAFNLNRAAVREAMLRLEGEGLLVGGGAYGGKYVRYIEDEDQMDVLAHYEMREAIEGMAVRLAARNMNGWQVDELRRLEAAFTECCYYGDREARQRAALDFYSHLLANCGNSLLLQAWETYNLMPLSQRSQEFEDMMKSRVPDSAHPENTLRPLVDAIEARDADEAERLMREKIRRFTDAVREVAWAKKES